LGWLVDNVEVIAPVDECACQPSGQPAPPEVLTAAGASVPLRTMRMIGVRALSADAGRSQAIRVTATGLAPPFHIWNGQSLFVGPPVEYSEAAARGFDEPGAGGAEATFLSASLQCNPFFTDWTQLGDEVVWIRGEFIVPSAIQIGGGGLSAPSAYAVQFVDGACSLGNESSFGVAMGVTSAGWGDVAELSGGEARAGNETVGVEDLVLLLQKFSGGGAPGGLPIKARTDMLGVAAEVSPILDGVISVSEVVAVADAFSGIGYPFAPSTTVVCP